MLALVLMVVWTFVGRKLGWFLSKALFYRVPIVVAGLLCIGWGLFAAFATRWLIEWQHVGWVIKVILYGSGAYVAIPNYGLLDESSIPDDVLI